MTRDERSKLLETRLDEMVENSKTTYCNVFLYDGSHTKNIAVFK